MGVRKAEVGGDTGEAARAPARRIEDGVLRAGLVAADAGLHIDGAAVDRCRAGGVDAVIRAGGIDFTR